MGDLFRCWRRQVGCTTLVMALVLWVGWLRGVIDSQSVQIETPWETYSVYEEHGHIRVSPSSWYTRLWGTVLSEPGHWINDGKFIIPLGAISAYLILWKPRKRTQSATAVIQSPQE